jgi:hypothetical protein
MDYSFLNYLYRNATSCVIDKNSVLRFYFVNCYDWPEFMDHFRSLSGNLKYCFTVSTDLTLEVSIGVKQLLLIYPKSYGKS